MGDEGLGALLAFGAAAAFGLNDAVVKKATHRVPTRIIVLYSLLVGFPTLLVASILLEGGLFYDIPWSLALGYVLVGIGHFVVGRTLMYYAIGRIGGGPAAIVVSTNPVITALIGTLAMGEPSTLSLWVGVLLVFTGAALASSRSEGGGFRLRDPLGFLVAFAANLTFSMTTVGIRFLNVSGGPPIFGATLSHFSAFVVYALLSLLLDGPGRLAGAPEKPLLIWAGFLVTFGQLFRYVALELTYASVVSPILSTFTFFALFFLRLLPGTREPVGLPQVVGALVTFSGVLAIVLA